MSLWSYERAERIRRLVQEVKEQRMQDREEEFDAMIAWANLHPKHGRPRHARRVKAWWRRIFGIRKG